MTSQNPQRDIPLQAIQYPETTAMDTARTATAHQRPLFTPTMRAFSVASVLLAGAALPVSCESGHAITGFVSTPVHTSHNSLATVRPTRRPVVLGGLSAASTSAPNMRKRDMIRNFVSDIWWTIISQPRPEIRDVSPEHYDGDRYHDQEQYELFDAMEVDHDLMQASIEKKEQQFAQLFQHDFPTSRVTGSEATPEAVLADWADQHAWLFQHTPVSLRASIPTAEPAEAVKTPPDESSTAEQSASEKMPDYRSVSITREKTLRTKVEQLSSRTEQLALQLNSAEQTAAANANVEHAAELNLIAKRVLRAVEHAAELKRALKQP
eukprot:1925058-Rhodomonas_salina.1